MKSGHKVALAAIALFFSGITTGASGALLFTNNSCSKTVNREVTKRAGGMFKERIKDRLELDQEQIKHLEEIIQESIRDNWQLRFELRSRLLESLNSLRPHLTETQQESLTQLQKRGALWQRRRLEQREGD